MSKPTRIIIPKTGIATGESQPRAVYDEMSSKVIGALGNVETMRASHVEPGSALSDEALEVLYGMAVGCVNAGVFRPGHKGFIISPHYESWWFADMTPTGYQVVLGPYPPDSRDKALADEVKWLHEHNIPTCAACTESPTGRLPSAEPNVQHLNEALPELDLTAAQAITFDFSGVEKRILEHYRQVVLDTIRANAFPTEEVESVNGWEHDGADTYECIVFIANPNGPSDRRQLSITFDPGTCCASQQTAARLDM